MFNVMLLDSSYDVVINMVIYNLVNKLCTYQKMVPFCVLYPVMPQTLAKHWPNYVAG